MLTSTILEPTALERRAATAFAALADPAPVTSIAELFELLTVAAR